MINTHEGMQDQNLSAPGAGGSGSTETQAPPPDRVRSEIVATDKPLVKWSPSAPLQTYYTEFKAAKSNAKVGLSVAIVKALNPSAHVTDIEAFMFIKQCAAMRLNPFTQDAYLVKYSDKQPAAMVIGLKAYNDRLITHPQFQAIENGIIARDKDGKEQKSLREILLPGEVLIGGFCYIWRKDRPDAPIKVEIPLDEWQKKVFDYDTKQYRPMANWAAMPAHMIAKQAKKMCIREAIPEIWDVTGTEEPDEFALDVMEGEFRVVDEGSGEMVKKVPIRDGKVQPAVPVPQPQRASSAAVRSTPAPPTPVDKDPVQKLIDLIIDRGMTATEGYRYLGIDSGKEWFTKGKTLEEAERLLPRKG